MSKIVNEAIDAAAWGTDGKGKRWEDYDTILCPDGTVIDMQNLLEEQERAKAALTHLAPAFGGFVSKLRFVYTFRIKTQATDGYNLFVNPWFTATRLDFTGKVFVMAHEVMHCLLNHMRRGRGHDPELSNIAADYEVNATLVDIDLVKAATIVKIGALYDRQYTDWGYEKIYDSHPSAPNSGSQNNSNQAKQAANNQQGKGGQSGQGQGQQGQGQGGGGGQQQQQYSEEYKKGWAQAIEDYKKGKIKL